MSLGISTKIILIRFTLYDPCPEMTLDLVQPTIMYNKQYFLGNQPIKYRWDNDSLIRRSTETGCGNLIVDIFYDDDENSAIDPELFTLSQDSNSAGSQFIVNLTDDEDAKGVYEFRFVAYFAEQP